MKTNLKEYLLRLLVLLLILYGCFVIIFPFMCATNDGQMSKEVEITIWIIIVLSIPLFPIIIKALDKQDILKP